VNDGKRFEADFRLSVGRYAIRLYDTTTGYSGVKNPCDFIYHTSPYLNLLELKSVKGKRLDYSIISENQKEQLTFFLSAKYVSPVILVEFRDFKRVFAIPFDVICEHIVNDKKSINISDCDKDSRVLEIQTKYRVTHCRLDVAHLNSQLRVIGNRLERRLDFE
jgi:penicillin-binding protein-related factor A (putative recombinase)